MNKTLTVSIIAVVVVAAAVAFYLRDVGSSVAQPDEAAQDVPNEQVTANATQPPATPRGDQNDLAQGGLHSPQQVVNDGGTLAQALGSESAITTAAEANLLFEGSQNCSLQVDGNVIGADEYAFDESRAWAVARMMEVCDGFDAQGYSVELDRPNLMQAMVKSGWGATKPVAEDTLRHSTFVPDVVLAGQLMLENGDFPFDEVDPTLRDLGGQEMLTALTRASMLRSCDAAGGCGPNSIQVAAICMNVGCPEGLTLAQVYERKMSQEELRAIRSIHSWMGRNSR